jgi:ubiquinone/menaquinone biosynthesis C-methylase UbiE
MESSEYRLINEFAENHWWYRSINGLIFELISNYSSKQTPIKILDAGCGPGISSVWLSRNAHYIGLDSSITALKYAIESGRPGQYVNAYVGDLPFTNESFDVAVVVTVLMSVNDDNQAIAEFSRILKENGILILLEPSFEIFRRGHDDIVHCIRRYRKTMLERLLYMHEFKLISSEYINFTLSLFALILHAIEKIYRRKSPPKSDLDRLALNHMFNRIWKFERGLSRYIKLPWGLEVCMVARKYKSEN